MNRNVIEPAATIAGRSSGRVTSRVARQGVAPSSRAADTRSAGSCDHMPPTTRTTTETLKNTWASTTAVAEVSSDAGSSDTNAAPTTTVGSRNGTVRSATSRRRPGKSQRATRYAGPMPATSVAAVLTAACHVVNQSTCARLRRPRVSPSTLPSTTVATSVATGHA
ncbi:unannotated protein [freshwater metagenome]|uniref:Unannotated protein n=1 Tax=freshwater metagenome TaxID=449393 RepID=A0A6J6DG74_9ZZZZ